MVKSKNRCEECGILHHKIYIYKGKTICGLCNKDKELSHFTCSECGNRITDSNRTGLCARCKQCSLDRHLDLKYLDKIKWNTKKIT